jgi:hypothetical protein
VSWFMSIWSPKNLFNFDHQRREGDALFVGSAMSSTP